MYCITHDCPYRQTSWGHPTPIHSITYDSWTCNCMAWCSLGVEKIKQPIYLTNHYSDVIMSAMSSQITGVSIVYWAVCSGANQRKHQSSTSLAFVRGIHRGLMNSSHKGPVTRKMLPFDYVIMHFCYQVVHLWDLRLVRCRICGTGWGKMATNGSHRESERCMYIFGHIYICLINCSQRLQFFSLAHGIQINSLLWRSKEELSLVFWSKKYKNFYLKTQTSIRYSVWRSVLKIIQMGNNSRIQKLYKCGAHFTHNIFCSSFKVKGKCEYWPSDHYNDLLHCTPQLLCHVQNFIVIT